MGVTAASGRWTRAAVPQVIVYGGRIHTVDDAARTVTALAIAGDRVLAVGDDAAIRALADPATRQVDLAGRTVVPGFVDGHNHMADFGLDCLALSLAGARSVGEVCARIAARAAERPPGEWIVTSPIGTAPYHLDAPGCLAEERFPTRAELDAAAPHHPVYIAYAQGKPPPAPALFNSRAFAALGLDRAAPPAALAERHHDADGQPGGRLDVLSPFATLTWLRERGLPRPTPEQYLDALRAATRAFLAAGITTIYEGHGVRLEELQAYAALHARGEMGVRSHLAVGLDVQLPLTEIEERLRWLTYSVPPGLGDDVLQVDGIGFSYDGIAGHGSALMHAPYTGYQGERWHGVRHISAEKLLEIARLAARYGLRVQLKCSGDAAIDEALDVFEAVDREVGIRQARWVLMHCQFPSAQAVARCRALSVVPTTCTNFLWGQASTAYCRYYGRERAWEAVPLRRWLDGGVPVVLSADYGPHAPMFGLWQALARQDALTGEAIGPAQRVTRAEALRLYTRHGAYAIFREQAVGSLEPGKLADLVVLSDDPLTCPEDAIREIQVLATLSGGTAVHNPGGLFS